MSVLLYIKISFKESSFILFEVFFLFRDFLSSLKAVNSQELAEFSSKQHKLYLSQLINLSSESALAAAYS